MNINISEFRLILLDHITFEHFNQASTFFIRRIKQKAYLTLSKNILIQCSLFSLEIDECLDDSHNCHEHASCLNTEGAFICTCHPGYHGDGVECDDTNECLEDATVCDEMAICTNLHGSYSCVCLDGYWLADDGYTCIGKLNSVLWLLFAIICFRFLCTMYVAAIPVCFWTDIGWLMMVIHVLVS